MNHTIVKTVLAAGLMLLTVLSSAWAQDGSALQQQAWLEKIQKLEALKQENPEAYREMIREKRAKLQALKEQNPQKFQEAVARDEKPRKARIERMKNEDPEKFKQFVGRRAKRLSQLEEKNPEKFNQLMEKKPGLREKYRAFKNRSENFQQPGENRGLLRARMQDSGQGDGSPISEAERQAAREQFLQNHPQAAKRTDRDGDGTAAPAEFRQGRLLRNENKPQNENRARFNRPDGHRREQEPAPFRQRVLHEQGAQNTVRNQNRAQDRPQVKPEARAKNR